MFLNFFGRGKAGQAKKKNQTRDWRRVVLRYEQLEALVVLNASFDYGTLVDGFEQQLTSIQNNLNASFVHTFTILPVIGESASETAGAAGSPAIAENVSVVFNGMHEKVAPRCVPLAANPSATETVLQQTVFVALKSYLGDNDYTDTDVSAVDVVIGQYDPANGAMSMDLNSNKVVTSSDGVPFNTGLPGFPFQITSCGTVSLSLPISLPHRKVVLNQGISSADQTRVLFTVGIMAHALGDEFDVQFGLLQARNWSDEAMKLQQRSGTPTNTDVMTSSF